MLGKTLHLTLFASLVLMAGTACALGGCSSDDSASSGDDADGASSSSGGSSATVTEAECSSACSDRTSECDVPEAKAGPICDSICGGTLSQATLDCITALPCTADDDDVTKCKNAKPSGGTSSSSGGSGTSSSSGGNVESEPATLTINVPYTESPSIAASYYTLSISAQSGVTTEPEIAVAQGPDTTKGTATIDGLPSGCEPEVTVSLGGSTKHSMVATILGPVAECGSFFEDLGDFDVDVVDATYDSGKKAHVTVHFTK